MKIELGPNSWTILKVYPNQVFWQKNFLAGSPLGLGIVNFLFLAPKKGQNRFLAPEATILENFPIFWTLPLSLPRMLRNCEKNFQKSQKMADFGQISVNFGGIFKKSQKKFPPLKFFFLFKICLLQDGTYLVSCKIQVYIGFRATIAR